ncbi:MAG: BTAD domain-containing putative transcriptional regulator [Actinomycetota bacterium]
MSASPFIVRALGPLTVLVDGEPVDIGGPKQRLLLARLLIDRDHAVSVDQLVDALWGDDPPPTARKALQVHVSKLRRALGEGFPLRTAPGAYLVQSAGFDFDVAEFEAAIDRATTVLRTDAGAASTELANALAMWNGPAFADLGDQSSLTGEITRLTELRVTALERRVDADLRLGRHTELVAELETLTIEFPYRERFREQHMLALYRAGRQTEALRVYDSTRSTLVDDLGIDPSPSLRALHTQILDHAAELDYHSDPDEPRLAFLATDLADSTSMWEANPEAMQIALARHDQILTDAVEANRGTVFKGTGDGIYAVFADAADGVQAAIDAQLALASESWPTDTRLQVRMAVDEGPASERDGDYFGPVLNRVSRIMSSAHGGQTLLPAELADRAPIPTRDLGTADYKGIGRVDVVQVDPPGLTRDFPTLRTDRAPKGVPRQGFGQAIRGYEVREQLGLGASGVVYRAYQASIGREVAIKVIRPELANRSGFVKRFEAEAQFVAQLEHPHIAPLYDYWRDPDGAYLVMQLLRGGSLADSLERSPWRPAAAMQLLEQVGAALDYAHRHGVLHRDLKPANVLLDGDGNAFLSDFGIATDHIDAVALPAESSVAYITPEELAGAPIGTAADIYGLTLLAYETLTGERPEPGGQPQPVTSLRPELPASLDRVLARGAHPDPERRFPRVADLLRALRQAFGADVIGRPDDDATIEVRNPYKGLRAFKETDAHDFFGRDEFVDELVERAGTHRFLAVVGPSGSGKSSVVRAGLLPRIRRGGLGVDGAVLISEMYPGSHPFEELEAALVRVAVAPTAGVMSELLGDERGLLRVTKQILPDDDSELVLVIDQFEELFSLTNDTATRDLFLASLVEVANDERSRVRIVVTLRADYFDRPLQHAEFGALLRTGLVPIAAPREHELAAAIIEPARQAGLDIESGLVARIVRDVADEPGALPLLQYALTALVEAREGRVLDVAAYERIGGVDGALAQRAEEIHNGLAPPAQAAAREVFLRLVRVDEHSDDTRRRAGRAELDRLGFPDAVIDSVVTAYGSFRLVSFDREPVSRGQTIEVAHEALIREWPRYRGWIDERRESLLVERRLETAAGDWDSGGRSTDLLVAGARLDQFERWADGQPGEPPDPVGEFIAESRSTADATARRTARRRRSIVTIVAALAVLALIGAAIAVVQRNRAQDQQSAAVAAAAQAEAEAANARAAEAAASAAADAESESATLAELARAEADGLRDDAQQQALIESSRALGLAALDAADDDVDLGVLLAVESARRAESARVDLDEPMRALFSTTAAHNMVLREQALDDPSISQPIVSTEPSGSRVAMVVAASSGSSGEVVIVDSDGGGRLRAEVADPTSVAWHGDRNVLLVGDRNGDIWSVDPDTGGAGLLLSTGAQSVEVWSVDDRWLLYKASDGRFAGLGEIVVADGQTLEPVLGRDGTWGAVAPDGAHVLIHPGPAVERAELYSLPDGRFVGSPDVFDGDSLRAAWSPDGSAIIVANFGAGEVLRIDVPSLDTSSAKFAGTVDARPVLISTVAVSPDGRWLAVGQNDGTVRVLDVDTLEQVARFSGHTNFVNAIVWGANSDRLVSLDRSRELMLWDTTSTSSAPRVVRAQSPHFPEGHVVRSDGRRVVGTREPGTEGFAALGPVEMWSPDPTAPAVELLQPTGGDAQFFRLGPEIDGGHLAASQLGDRVVVFDALSGEELLVVPGADASPIGFSPDGTTAILQRVDFAAQPRTSRVAAVDIETGQELWSIPDLAAVVEPDPAGDVLYVLTGPGVFLPEARGPELLVVDLQSGAELASHRLRSGDGWIVATQSGAHVVVVERGEDGDRVWILLFDASALRSAPDTALVAGRELASQELPLGFAVSADESTIVIPTGTVGDEIDAYALDDELARRWSLATGGLVAYPATHDGHVWLPSPPLSPLGDTPRFDLLGIPLDMAEYADWASTIPNRDFTEAECERYLGGPCAETLTTST